MTDEQKTTIKSYVTTLDNTIQPSDLLDLIVDTVGDRVLLYLNDTTLDPSLERIVAQVVVAQHNSHGEAHEQTIAAVVDNGQEVRYHQTPVNYFGSKSDSELFSGFERLLAPYRRVHVITSEL